VAESTLGRHRAPGRYNPLSELSVVVSRSAEPAVKTSAVLAASGGLVAAFALPAQAGATSTPTVDDTPDSTSATALPATFTSLPDSSTDVAPPEVTAPAVVAPKAVAPASTGFGELDVKAVAKPEPEPEVVAAAEDQANSVRSTDTTSRDTTRTTTTSTPTTTPTQPAAGGVLDIAASLAGIYYVYGGTTPAGFDCSGFTMYVFAQVGISLPRTAEQQRQAVTPVSDPQPGDLVFFGVPAYHVGIYAGDGMMWDSPRTGKAVALRSVFSGVSMYGRP
jgi:cell wall-associated NlpC family hydrolase